MSEELKDLTKPEALQDDKEGQKSDSPTDNKGARKEPESPAGDKKKEKDKLEKAAPYDKDPKWKKARAAEKNLSELLDEYGFDDMDQVKKALSKGLSLQEMFGNEDAEQVLQEAKTLRHYNKVWAQQKEEQLRETETPEETIERMDKKLREIEEKSDKERQEFIEAQETQKLVRTFEDSMDRRIKESDLPDHAKPLALFLAGIDHPLNTADISKRRERAKIANMSIKRLGKLLKEHEKIIIDNYVKGKHNIPDIPTDKGQPPPSEKPVEPKNLKESRKLAGEAIRKIFGK